MQLIQYKCKIPEENLALDELLLSEAETGRAGETLRLWESQEYFVVLGRAGKMNEECFIERCREDGVKILRRVSGGGTVLQGPGCINYSLILSYERDKTYRDITGSYRTILEKISAGFLEHGIQLEFLPVSDMAVSDNKVSGNAQARKKKFFLHHGTLLLSFDIGKIGCYLKHPKKEPDYRKKREHKEFLTNLDIGAEELKKVIEKIFINDIKEILIPGKDLLGRLKDLAYTKYASDEWNYMF